MGPSRGGSFGGRAETAPARRFEWCGARARASGLDVCGSNSYVVSSLTWCVSCARVASRRVSVCGARAVPRARWGLDPTRDRRAAVGAAVRARVAADTDDSSSFIE